MKFIDKFKDYLVSTLRDIQPIVVDPNPPQIVTLTQAQSGEIKIDQDETSASTSAIQETETQTEVEEEVEQTVQEIAEELIPIEKEVTVATTKEQDDKEEGFADPLYIFATVYRVPFSAEYDLNITFESLYEYRMFLQVFTPNRAEQSIETRCCVQDLPIQLIFNGTLIYTHNSKNEIPFLTALNTSSNEYGEKDCCCCELPPPPEPNYWFTYTNCDGEAYIDIYIQDLKCDYCNPEGEIPTFAHTLDYGKNDSEYGSGYDDSIQHYRVEFFPGFEPECGCDITSVISNVLHASSINDFVNPFINSREFPEERYADGITYTTHFEDECGVCWSIVNLAFDGGVGIQSDSDYYPTLYLVPICGNPVEFDSICYYDKIIENEFGTVNYYSEDGYYSYENHFTRITDSGTEDVQCQISFDVNVLFLELNGDSLLAFSIQESWCVEVDGTYTYHDLPVNLIVDLPDNIDFSESALEQFILCSEQHYEEFFPVLAKFSSIATEELESNGFVSDETALFIATLFLQSYSQNSMDPYGEPGYGVLEDIQNNVYGLCYDGEINTSPFIVPLFNVPDTYMTNVQLCTSQAAEISNIPLEICFCNEALVERFESWQQTACNSEYGNPFKYVQNNLNAHYVNDGTQAYIEINFNVPLLYTEGCEGYSEAVQRSIRICIDDCEIKDITQLCIDTQALFENYYQNGYVDFENLFSFYYSYDNQAVYFKDECGNCYVVNEPQEQELLRDSREGSMYCDLELNECECETRIVGNTINSVQQVFINASEIILNVNDHSYNLNFNFIHNAEGTFLQVNYIYDGTIGNITENAYINITGTDLDCCCGLEDLILDANNLYQFAYNYYNTDGDIISLTDFLYYFSTEGNLNFYDCEDNCYNIVNTYIGDELPPEFAVQPCDSEVCCEQKINIEFEASEEMPAEREVNKAIAPLVEENCFDQFFDFKLVHCNDLTYIDFTWYYNQNEVRLLEGSDTKSCTGCENSYNSNLPTPDDCFNFSIYSNHLLISIPDELEVSCACPINKIIIPEDVQAYYEQYFQDCCTLSDYNHYWTGYDFIDQLIYDEVIFASECENYIIDKSSIDGSYVLVAVDDDLNLPSQEEESGLSLRENATVQNGSVEKGTGCGFIDWDIESISLDTDQLSSIKTGNTIFGSETTEGNNYCVAELELSILNIDEIIEPAASIPLGDPNALSAISTTDTANESTPVPPPIMMNVVEETQIVCA